MNYWSKHEQAIKRAWAAYLAAAPRYNFGVRQKFTDAFREEWKRP